MFANTDPAPSPPPIIVNRVIPKKEVKDEDYKQRYSSAVAAWVIVLIIVGLATMCITYIWCKGKQVMGELASEMIKSETLLNQRRALIEEQKVLIIGGHMKANQIAKQYEINNPTVTDNLVHDDDDEDELEAIYNIDGTLNRFAQRGTTVDIKRGPNENGVGNLRQGLISVNNQTTKLNMSANQTGAHLVGNKSQGEDGAGVSEVLMGSNQNVGVNISGAGLSSIRNP